MAPLFVEPLPCKGQWLSSHVTLLLFSYTNIASRVKSLCCFILTHSLKKRNVWRTERVLIVFLTKRWYGKRGSYCFVRRVTELVWKRNFLRKRDRLLLNWTINTKIFCTVYLLINLISVYAKWLLHAKRLKFDSRQLQGNLSSTRRRGRFWSLSSILSPLNNEDSSGVKRPDCEGDTDFLVVTS
jgi:hypothetical protein